MVWYPIIYPEKSYLPYFFDFAYPSFMGMFILLPINDNQNREYANGGGIPRRVNAIITLPAKTRKRNGRNNSNSMKRNSDWLL